MKFTTTICKRKLGDEASENHELFRGTKTENTTNWGLLPNIGRRRYNMQNLALLGSDPNEERLIITLHCTDQRHHHQGRDSHAERHALERYLP